MELSIVLTSGLGDEVDTVLVDEVVAQLDEEGVAGVQHELRGVVHFSLVEVLHYHIHRSVTQRDPLTQNLKYTS